LQSYRVHNLSFGQVIKEETPLKFENEKATLMLTYLNN